MINFKFSLQLSLRHMTDSQVPIRNEFFAMASKDDFSVT